MLTAVMACGHSSRATGSITEEFQAGVSTAVQQPHTNTSNSTEAGPPQPESTSSVSNAQAPTCASNAPEINRRRSVVSASTPAGKIGRLPDRPVYLVVASGGWFTRPSPVGTPAQPDFLTPYLRTILATIGLRTLHVLTLEGVTRGADAEAHAVATATAALDRLLPPLNMR